MTTTPNRGRSAVLDEMHANRDDRRQRRRRVRHLRPGRPGLRHPAAVDPAAAGARALRQPGNGAAPGSGDRGRPRAADPGAVREVLGRVQLDRLVHSQLADARDRVHRRHAGRWVSRPAEGALSRAGGRGGHRGGVHRQLPPVRADRGRVLRRVAAADPGLRDGASARPTDGPRLRGAGHARRLRAASHGDAAGHRDRRHHHRALAAVLPAVLRHRQADHPPAHELRASRPVDRHRHRHHRRGRHHGRRGGRVRRHEGLRELHRRRRPERGPGRVRREGDGGGPGGRTGGCRRWPNSAARACRWGGGSGSARCSPTG